MKRRKSILIDGDKLVALMAGTQRATRSTMEELPWGTEFVGAWFDPRRNAFEVVFAHESFNEVPPGSEVPRVAAEWETAL